MKLTSFIMYLLVLAGVTYLIRALPFVLIRKKITNRFIRSFLAYVPYAVLAAMTLPSVLFCTNSFWTALIGTVGAVIVSLLGGGLSLVALVSCTLVFLAGFWV